ncbi:cupin [Bacillus coahuilensis p1.1.43]|uniref:Cupin n=1 Tax=Bacillus coahuilensis p1.1.43 TaxID=1150625 RepID=A0A147KBG3_9BACI|nr:cupin domain-containing protein [Bacillus coahuilensis]KUP08314.1 cupin [Bacillus coahuilensis p1.1.43]
MKVYSFKKENGKKITKFDSNFVMSKIAYTKTATHIGYMHLDEKGIIGYHKAVIPQILLVVGGEGEVRGETDEYVKVEEGDAIYWEKGEWHETRTEKGLTAIVMESEDLESGVIVR